MESLGDRAIFMNEVNGGALIVSAEDYLPLGPTPSAGYTAMKNLSSLLREGLVLLSGPPLLSLVIQL